MQEDNRSIRTVGVHRQRPYFIVRSDAGPKLHMKSFVVAFNSCENCLYTQVHYQRDKFSSDCDLLDNIMFSVESSACFEWKFHRSSDEKNDLQTEKEML